MTNWRFICLMSVCDVFILDRFYLHLAFHVLLFEFRAWWLGSFLQACMHRYAYQHLQPAVVFACRLMGLLWIFGFVFQALCQLPAAAQQ